MAPHEGRQASRRVPGWPASFQLGDQAAVPARDRPLGLWGVAASSSDPQSSLWLQGTDGLAPGTLPGGSEGPGEHEPRGIWRQRGSGSLKATALTGLRPRGWTLCRRQGQGLGAWQVTPLAPHHWAPRSHRQGEPTLGSGLSREVWSQLGTRTAIPTPEPHGGACVCACEHVCVHVCVHRKG